MKTSFRKNFRGVIAGLRTRLGFTLIELLVVIAIIGILAAMLMPTLSRAKGAGLSIACINNLKQLGYATMLYVDDHNGEFPRRSSPSWMETLRANYQNFKILKCPADNIAASDPNSVYEAHRPPRSYIYNGWNDYFQTTLSQAEWTAYTTYKWPNGIKQSVILHVSDTVVFGEKEPTSRHVHMDFYQGNGNDVEELEQQMHNRTQGGKGSSNYMFADGSVRGLRFSKSLSPFNLWAVTDYYRTNSAVHY